MKYCNSCNTNKSLNEYQKDSSKQDGFKTNCKKCCSISKKAKYKITNHTITIDKCECCTCKQVKPVSEFNKNIKNPKGIFPYCKDCRAIKSRIRYETKSEEIKKKNNQYYHSNKETALARQLDYQKRKMKEDPLYVMSRRLRNRLYYALKRQSWNKNTKFFDYIGCSLEELKNHIERQFKPGMTWDNRATWHLDHIVPLISATSEEQLYKLCHYTNIQPMWGADNIKKGGRL